MRDIFKKIRRIIAIVRNRILPDSLRKVKVGNFEIFVNRTHALPRYLREKPSYSANFPRVVSLVRALYPNLVVLDVGANIGDTVALVRSATDCPMVCIEGDDFFFSILKKNITQFNNVHAYQYFLGEKDTSVVTNDTKRQGTFSIDTKANTRHANTIQTHTLDTFLKKENPCKNRDAKVLKIDTDGYDLKILRGGKHFIEENHPVLFFEYDRAMLTRVGDDGLETLEWLKRVGYSSIIFYDNAGRFIFSTTLRDMNLVRQMYQYTLGKESAFPYYDICLFHEDDSAIAKKFIEEEQAMNV